MTVIFCWILIFTVVMPEHEWNTISAQKWWKLSSFPWNHVSIKIIFFICASNGIYDRNIKIWWSLREKKYKSNSEQKQKKQNWKKSPLYDITRICFLLSHSELYQQYFSDSVWTV